MRCLIKRPKTTFWFRGSLFSTAQYLVNLFPSLCSTVGFGKFATDLLFSIQRGIHCRCRRRRYYFALNWSHAFTTFASVNDVTSIDRSCVGERNFDIVITFPKPYQLNTYLLRKRKYHYTTDLLFSVTR